MICEANKGASLPSGIFYMPSLIGREEGNWQGIFLYLELETDIIIDDVVTLMFPVCSFSLYIKKSLRGSTVHYNILFTFPQLLGFFLL